MAANLNIVDWFTELDDDQRDLFLNKVENEDYLCPIGRDLMIDPVVAADGFTYERTKIEERFKTNMTSPKTQAPLENTVLIPNHTFKGLRDKALQKFKEDLPLLEAERKAKLEAKIEGQIQNPTPNPLEAVALTPTVSKSSAVASYSPPPSSSSIVPSYSSPPSSSSKAPPVAPFYSSPPSSSSSSSIARSPEEEGAIQEYTRRLGIIQILGKSTIVDRELRKKIQEECDSTIEKIDENFPKSRAQISQQEIDAAELDFVHKLNAIPADILSLYNSVREEYFGLADKIKSLSLTPAATFEAMARQGELRTIQKQLEEDWPEIRYRLLLDQAEGIPIQSFAGAVSINTVPRRPVIPAPYLVNGPYPVDGKANASIPSQESSFFRAGLHNLKCSFKSRFFSEAASVAQDPKPFDSEPDYLFKISVIGDSGAGKSCLILRYADDTYTAHPMPTIGVDFKIKTIALNESIVRLQIWDTTERNRRLLQANPLRGAHAIIVAFDVTNRASFDNVAQYLKENDRYADESVVVTLVATKCDAPKAEWKVSDEEIKTFAMHLNKDVFFTSSKVEENGFVDRLFEGVAQSVLQEKAPQHFYRPKS